MQYYVRKNTSIIQNGSMESPFSTISQAAAAALPGDTVWIGDGTYREWVSPPVGGTDEGHRITYRNIEGEHPVLSGSEIIDRWERVDNSLYKAVIPRDIFGDYCPFEDTVRGDWLDRGELGIVHHTGEIFADGEALFEAPSLDKIDQSSNPIRKNSWYSECKDGQVSIWIFMPDSPPESHVIEASFRPYAFFPNEEKINYITVSGLIIENVATQWSPPTAFQSGAIGPNWSRGWIIENCIVRNSKCVGVILGKRREGTDNQWSRNPSKGGAQTYTETVFTNLKRDWNKETVGGHIVRNNEIYNCGQAGIAGSMGCIFSKIENNHIYNINNRLEFDGAEVAGIKFHAAIDTLIKGNVVHNTKLGLWLDWQAQGARVTSNVFFESRLFDMFIEVCHGPCTVDHNLFLSPVSNLSVSQGIAYVHNLFAGKTQLLRELKRFTMYHFPHDTAVLGSILVYGGDDKVYNNAYIGEESGTSPYDEFNGRDYIPDTSAAEYPILGENALSLGVFIDNNAYFNGAKPSRHDEDAAVQTAPAEVRVVSENGIYYLESNLPESLFDLRCMRITTDLLGKSFESGAKYENIDGSPLCLDTDFCGETRAQTTVPGPFEKFVTRIQLTH